MPETKKSFNRFISSLGVFMLTCVYTFFITNKYHNITATKYFFFNITAAVFLAACLICYIIEKRDRFSVQSITKMSTADFFMLMFLFVSFFSFLACSNRAAAFNGMYGRRMGFVMILGMAMAYFFISKFYTIDETEFNLFGISTAAMCVFGAFQYFGFDPLHLLSTISPESRVAFIGFIGNVDVYSAYLCIAVPFAMCMACFAKSKPKFFFWLAVSYLGFLGTYTSTTDGVILGLAATFIILFVVSCRTLKSFRRFWVVCFAFSLMIPLVNHLNKVSEGFRQRLSFTFFRYIMPSGVYVPVMVVVAVLALVFYLIPINDKALGLIRKAAVILTCGFVGIVLIVFFYFSVINKDYDLGYNGRFIRFSDEWGSGRGLLWKNLFIAMKDQPVYKWFIGTGEESISMVLTQKFGSNVFEGGSVSYDNAHSEPIQYLITQGVWGLVTYLGLVITSVITCIKSDSILKKAVMMSILVYFIQSMVNIIQPITTPLMFVFLGLAQSRTNQLFICDKNMTNSKEDLTQ